MMYEVVKTNDGFMVVDQSTGDYVHDEQGNNLFDSENEAKKLLTIARMRDAMKNLFGAIEEGDSESTVGLAIRYNELFEGVKK
jgi:hypothetical protein